MADNMAMPVIVGAAVLGGAFWIFSQQKSNQVAELQSVASEKKSKKKKPKPKFTISLGAGAKAAPKRPGSQQRKRQSPQSSSYAEYRAKQARGFDHVKGVSHDEVKIIEKPEGRMRGIGR